MVNEISKNIVCSASVVLSSILVVKILLTEFCLPRSVLRVQAFTL